MMYFVLSFITVIILTLVAAQDFRERMIYSFPVLILTVIWMIYSNIFLLGKDEIRCFRLGNYGCSVYGI